MNLSLVFCGLAVCALLLTSLLVPVIRRVATSLQLVDRPSDGAYKTHTRATPYGGGVAIWLGALVPLSALVVGSGARWDDGLDLWAPNLLLPLQSWSPTIVQASQVLAVVAASTALLLLGLADDRRAMPPLPRFAVQIVLAAALVLFVPGFGWPGLSGPPGAFLSIFWLVALTNAFNFLDNMNGLAAGLAAFALGACGAIALGAGHVAITLICLSLMGACTGFLLYNFPRASIFMGDAGGLCLGFLGAAVSLLVSNELALRSPGLAVAPLVVFAVPLYDLVTVVSLRLRAGQAPWIGDTRHISHRLVQAGCSRPQAVVVLYGLAAAAGLVGTSAAADPELTDRWLLLGALLLLLFGLVDWRLARRQRAL